ncbi:transcriptional regulator, GntR family [Rhodopseudomonas palustris HaA2]|uniref:Transcriptional regulator, GntR family n=1 Tax=Rhodopseudomonas palustris (strain HaA2) TaxID=316058 RepID=Q2ISM9_RHOP2|nr:phosphonate metabolism transcriptional regulator PhnF [Rhodopseudomonas palustris]ABD08781.1 transcriptional regulator, GntR family [Rhodopseudomonas palustris HaA2]
MTTLEPDSGVALWRKVADSIERGIADGHYAAGEKLPGEVEIAQAHRVNRHTVRRALAALAERGLVRAERGSGTYVETSRIAYPLRSRTRFSEIVGAGGHEPRGRLLAASREAATKDLARQLDLAAGAPLIRIEGLRLADRAPICVGTTWCSAERFPEAETLYRRFGSMTKVLAQYGVCDYRRASTRITAAIADAGDAARLDLGIGRPVLIVEALDVDGEGHPLLAIRSRFAAERVQFVVETE